MFSLADIFTAYYDCRRHKRNTYGALEFELHYESECIKLWREIESRSYKLQPCTAFIVRDPVQREIFASHFRDRVVHHLIARRLEPVLERVLIHDVYSSRKWKGTHYGISRIDHFMRSCSENYQKDAYILKLDISGFFMSIDRERLWEKVKDLIISVLIPPCERGLGGFCSGTKPPQPSLSRGSKAIPPDEQDKILYLIKIIIFTDVRKCMKIVGKREDWIWLPRNKSLFYVNDWCWLPIGNLTSQIFANIHMHEFDIFVKKTLKMKYYGRYVDDFILIHNDREYLKGCTSQIRAFLETNASLTLHPKKIYFQHISKWVLFLGTFIKPYRKYVGKRTKGNFWKLIEGINGRIAEQNFDQQGVCSRSTSLLLNLRWHIHRIFTDEEKEKIVSQINSYLGLMSHAHSYALSKKMIEGFCCEFFEDFVRDVVYHKILLKMKNE